MQPTPSTGRDASGRSRYVYLLVLIMCLLIVAVTAPLNIFLIFWSWFLIALFFGNSIADNPGILNLFCTLALQIGPFVLFWSPCISFP
jgi:hypothetical protein